MEETQATIYFKDGRMPAMVPLANLENVIRIEGDSIARVDNPLVKKRTKKPIIKKAETKLRKPTLKELKNSDKDVLKALASQIAKKNKISPPHHAMGVENLAKWINKNQ